MMRIGSLFSGIGGLELGLERSGLGKTVWQVEIDEKAILVLSEHWPDVVRHRDVTTVGANTLEPVDLICGGFPCQDLSCAGKQAGIDAGKRSGLWREFGRVVGEMAPRWVVVENVHHTWRKWVPRVRSDLWGLGYTSVPIRVRASDLGAPHERARCFIIANSDRSRKLQLQRGLEAVRRWIGNSLVAPANSDGVVLRIEQGRGGGQGGACAIEPSGDDRDTDSAGHERGGLAWEGASVVGTGWWAVEPDVVRMVHGLPGRVDRVRLLGNSVVPQVAEVVGRFVKVLETGNI